MSLASSILIVEDAKIKLTQINGAQGTAVKTKIETVLGKNEGYKLMVKTSNILSGDQENFEGLREDLKLNDLVYFNKLTALSIICDTRNTLLYCPSRLVKLAAYSLSIKYDSH